MSNSNYGNAVGTYANQNALGGGQHVYGSPLRGVHGQQGQQNLSGVASQVPNDPFAWATQSPSIELMEHFKKVNSDLYDFVISAIKLLELDISVVTSPHTPFRMGMQATNLVWRIFSRRWGYEIQWVEGYVGGTEAEWISRISKVGEMIEADKERRKKNGEPFPSEVASEYAERVAAQIKYMQYQQRAAQQVGSISAQAQAQVQMQAQAQAQAQVFRHEYQDAINAANQAVNPPTNQAVNPPTCSLAARFKTYFFL
jgi:hypothetical protein